MKKIELKSLALLDSFTPHSKIKNDLLFLMSKQLSDKLNHNDNIEKLDWSQHKDMSRPWVQLVKTDLINHFKKCAKILHYEDIELKALWFQQYDKSGVHNWHSHGDNYTGVYYVEMSKENPKTELIEPATNKKITLECKEGDIIIFPAFMIHRAPINKSEKRKTIVSFNFNFTNADNEYSKNFN